MQNFIDLIEQFNREILSSTVAVLAGCILLLINDYCKLKIDIIELFKFAHKIEGQMKELKEELEEQVYALKEQVYALKEQIKELKEQDTKTKAFLNNYAIHNEYKLYQTEVNMNVSNGNAQFNDMYLLYKNGTKLNFITSKFSQANHRVIKECIIFDTKKFIGVIDSSYVKQSNSYDISTHFTKFPSNSLIKIACMLFKTSTTHHYFHWYLFHLLLGSKLLHPSENNYIDVTEYYKESYEIILNYCLDHLDIPHVKQYYDEMLVMSENNKLKQFFDE
jgi:hypothetical protein